MYKGEWVAGVRQGYGVHILLNGQRYDGPWHRDRMHGEGIWSIPYTKTDLENAEAMDDAEKASWRDISVRYLGEDITAEKEAAAKIRAEAAKGIADTLVARMNRRTFRNLPPPVPETGGASVASAASIKSAAQTTVAADGHQLSEEERDEAAAKFGSKLFDADEEGTLVYEPNVLEDVTQLLDLSRNNYDGAGLFEWRQAGTWDYEHDGRTAVHGLLKSKVATIEFKKKFPITSKDPVLFVSEYATSVASYLPFLPDGVDPDDVIVRFIVERLIQENPGNAGVDGLKKAEKAVKDLLPKADVIFASVGRLEKKLAPLQEALKVAEEKAATSLARVKTLEKEREDLNQDLEDYWEKDPKHTRKDYLAAVERLKLTTRTDWYNLRTLQYPFQAKIVDTLMQFFSIIVGTKNDWPNLLLWFSNSDANIKAGVREALIRMYEVRLVDMVSEGKGFDVLNLAASTALGAAMPYMSHPDLHPDNVVFRFLSGALGSICSWCKATFMLARYSLAMVPKRKALEMVNVNLNTMQQVHNRNVEALHDAAAAADACEKELKVALTRKDESVLAIADARRDMLRAREIQERYLGSRIETVHRGGFQLGIKYLPQELLRMERNLTTFANSSHPRRQSAVDVDDLLTAVRAFWDSNSTVEERLLFPPKELPPDSTASAVDDLDAAWGDDDEDAADGYEYGEYGEYGGEAGDGTAEYDEDDELPENTWVILRSKDNEGRKYFYHTGTAESAWVEPDAEADAGDYGDDEQEPLEEEWSDGNDEEYSGSDDEDNQDGEGEEGEEDDEDEVDV
jgi:hypothetical protein